MKNNRICSFKLSHSKHGTAITTSGCRAIWAVVTLLAIGLSGFGATGCGDDDGVVDNTNSNTATMDKTKCVIFS